MHVIIVYQENKNITKALRHSVLIVHRFLIVSAAKYDTLGMLRMVERRMTGPTYSAALMVTPRAVVSSR